MDEGPGASRPYVSRAGSKLAHALEAFRLDPAGWRCCDFGCNVGGFTDCLLRAGAAEVIAIDTGYGTLAWSLRSDERVVTLERTNALHATPASTHVAGDVDLVVIDLAWTPQRLAVPAALGWLGPAGRIVTLVKPHYELDEAERAEQLVGGVLDPADAEAVTDRVLGSLADHGVRVVDRTVSPLTGRKSGRKAGRTSGRHARRPGAIGPGNVEHLALLERA